MTTAPPAIPADAAREAAPASAPGPVESPALDLPREYAEIRADPAIQFAPLEIKPPEVREPSWLERALQALFDWLGDVFSPVGGAIASGWSLIQWALVAGLALFVLYLVVRFVGPLAARPASTKPAEHASEEWRPDQRESLTLLEDADRLAGEGRFDEAARLLLRRSIGQIAAARPDWVAPSSTARELASLPRLSHAAKRAFSTLSAAVESSLFALQRLSREDWERARQAYADFALACIDEGGAADRSASGGVP